MATVPLLMALLLAAAPAVAEPLELMPLSEVRPGMTGTVRTVFEGDRVEEFQAEIIGVMDDFLGPDMNIILARLKGERVEYTGVAGGMSGSPVYVEGRLVGALAYRMGQFNKEPIAGITPIEYMLEVGDDGGAGPRAAEAQSEYSGLEPIEAPLTASGIPRSILEAFAPDLHRLGLGPLAAGSGASGDRSDGARRLAPGDPVAAQLVRGDITVAATGTVTHVDGDRVFAFGHPAFLTGAAELAMARAEIFLTLASLQASTKVGRVLETIGTFRQSRLPAMTGVIGPVPRMIPLTVRITVDGGISREFRYEIVEHRDFAPALAGLLAAASVVNTPWGADEMTLTVRGRIEIDGHRAVELGDLYIGFTALSSAGLALGRDLQSTFGVVYQNRFESPRVRSIDLEISAVERGDIGVVEAVYPTRTEVEPGDSIEFRVLIRPFRGRPYTRAMTYRVPDGAPSGPMLAYIGGANLLSGVERSVLSRQVQQADDLSQLIGLINQLRSNDRLYLKIVRREAGAVVQNEILPALPPSVQTTLGANRGTGEVTPIAETPVHEEALVLDQIIVGGTAVLLRVR